MIYIIILNVQIHKASFLIVIVFFGGPYNKSLSFPTDASEDNVSLSLITSSEVSSFNGFVSCYPSSYDGVYPVDKLLQHSLQPLYPSPKKKNNNAATNYHNPKHIKANLKACLS